MSISLYEQLKFIILVLFLPLLCHLTFNTIIDVLSFFMEDIEKTSIGDLAIR